MSIDYLAYLRNANAQLERQYADIQFKFLELSKKHKEEMDKRQYIFPHSPSVDKNET